jgi:hypothetical protein
VKHKEQSWLIWAILALVLASSLPYLTAWAATPPGARFTGLVFNPIDGHSYLAKMRQGFEGSWRFHLAFTPEWSSGAHIFLFHLWLGHLARLVRLPLIVVYHGARIVGGVAMLTALYTLARSLSDQTRERRTMFLLAAVGSGLGWLLLLTGMQTADLWVPEAFPAYSLMANAHFPLAIGLMVGTVHLGLHTLALESGSESDRDAIWPWGVAMTLTAMTLGAIQPFGLVPAFGGLGVILVAQAAARRRKDGSSVPWRAGAWIVVAATAALPYPLYMQNAIQTDPILAAWNAQNVTASPPLWDWALSYGLILILAALGGSAAVQRGSNADLAVLGWTGVTFIGMYLPLPLQRRLSIGLGAPLGLLAGMGWWRRGRRWLSVHSRGLVQGIIIAFSALTPLLLIATATSAALGPQASKANAWLYLSDGEWAALEWLRDQGESQPKPVVLCAPQTGSFVPAWTGHRVVYGHPFETIHAERRAEKVEAYWSGEMSPSEQEAFIVRNRVQYILVGPRERAITPREWDSVELGKLVFETDDTFIYAVNGP